MKAITASWKVFHIASLSSGHTGRRFCSEMPRSPRTKSPSQLVYWEKPDLLSPSCSRRRIWSSARTPGSRTLLGSVVDLIATNTSTLAMRAMNTDHSNRRAVYLSRSDLLRS
jgi:hypothetical protein